MNAPQGSAEWLASRCGFLTASVIADMMARTKSGWAASRDNLRARLVAERLTGIPQDSFTNAAMQWGTEHEPLARAAYEVIHGVMVDQVGMIPHPEIAFSGASPDGLVNGDGLVEIKCPNTATHIEYLLAGEAPKKYQPQMLWQMECTGREWCDFASFDPRMPPALQLFVVRFHRDDAKLKEIRDEARIFLAEIEEVINQLNKRVA